ncbi:succinylglutamate desuccinylase [Salinivibrio sp. ES.052]|uniref:succinylglutamate desuccinylase n=1 Tax=Salinivibrio sp. ES.052 TaxID=1882823 RepID=UPI0009270270|nr:succinylglutamate desuccinylase [Salinivibrio sp. ES.052]SIN86454.1 succinylglutamate desuccinylase [Salinivibrio sp. ES.052]
MLTARPGAFIDAALTAPHAFHADQWRMNTLTITHRMPGIVVVQPDSPTGDRCVVLSSGIHGDETAPIELIDRLLADILSGALTPTSPLLLIIGHAEAIKVHTRFIEDNLNRLFGGWNDEKNEEHYLANQLQQAVSDFFAVQSSSMQRWHLDLHSAIRDSHHYMFGVIPTTPEASDVRPLAALLNDAQMDATVLSQSPSPTFSWYSANHHHALAATLEMGRVAPLYKNDMREYAPLDRTLRTLLTAADLPSSLAPMRFYRVTRTLTKRSEQFALTFPSSAKNFTPFEKGTLLATDMGEDVYAEHEGEVVIFPNAHVQVGHRAGLLATPFDADVNQPLYVCAPQKASA